MLLSLSLFLVDQWPSIKVSKTTEARSKAEEECCRLCLDFQFFRRELQVQFSFRWRVKIAWACLQVLFSFLFFSFLCSFSLPIISFSHQHAFMRRLIDLTWSKWTKQALPSVHHDPKTRDIEIKRGQTHSSSCYSTAILFVPLLPPRKNCGSAPLSKQAP